nr:GreA/GreB family elongation factor [Cupriavidus sp. SK-3]
MPADVVTMFTRFVCIDLTRRQKMIWTLVYPEETDHSLGRICIFSPAALALLGSREGDLAPCSPAPDILLELQVQRILFQPEAAGIPEMDRCAVWC